MRSLAVVLVLCASLAHAQTQCNVDCGAVIGGLLATAVVVAIHGTFFHGLAHDDVNALQVGGWGMIILYGLGALVAAGFLFDTLFSGRTDLAVGGASTWLAASIAHAGLGAYGVHRVMTLSLGPLPGGANVGVGFRF
jgi:hypothetical protein